MIYKPCSVANLFKKQENPASEFTTKLNWTELNRVCKCAWFWLNWTAWEPLTDRRACKWRTKSMFFCYAVTTEEGSSSLKIYNRTELNRFCICAWFGLNWTALEPLTDCRVCKWQTKSAFFCCAVTTEAGSLSFQIYNWTELNWSEQGLQMRTVLTELNWTAWEQLIDCRVVNGKKIIGFPAAREQL